MTYWRSLVAVVAFLALAGCASAGSSLPRGAAATGGSASPQPLSAAQRCGKPSAASTALHVASSGGAVLDAYEIGSGFGGVVLVPELGRRNLCGWWSYAAYLAGRGLRVLIFDHQCTGLSTCPTTMAANALVDDITAAAAALRRAGAQRIVLVGASRGGTEVVIVGAHPPDGVVGVIAVSADDLTDPLASPPYPASAATAAPLLALPSMFVVAANDPFVSVTATQALLSSVPVRAKQLVVVPASQQHGWDLFDAATAPSSSPSSSPSDEMVAFLTAVLS